MKRSVLFVLLFIMLVAIILTSCGKDANEGPDDTTETEQESEKMPHIELPKLSEPKTEITDQIVADYQKYLQKNFDVSQSLNPEVYVTRYYGSYNEAMVVKLDGMSIRFNTEIWEEDIAGIKLRYYDGNLIKVWKDGDFCTLADAYKTKLLTKEEVYIISELHKNKLYIEMNTNWIANQFDRAKYAVSSMFDHDKEIISDFLRKDISKIQWVDPNQSNTILTNGIRCYGHFGKGSFIFIPNESETETTKKYFDCTFTHHTSFDIYFLCKNTVMSLEDAYNEEYFTLEELAQVENNHIVTYIYNKRIKNEQLEIENSDFSKIVIQSPSEELLSELERDYTDHIVTHHNADPEIDVHSVSRYYGNIDGIIAVSFDSSFPGWVKDTDIEIAGIIFHHFGTCVTIELWIDGEFYNLGEAYERGLISRNQLAEIAYIQRNQLYIKDPR